MLERGNYNREELLGNIVNQKDLVAGGGFELQSPIDPTQPIDSTKSENGTLGTNGISFLHFSYSFPGSFIRAGADLPFPFLTEETKLSRNRNCVSGQF
jgi:hypothetical protein